MTDVGAVRTGFGEGANTAPEVVVESGLLSHSGMTDLGEAVSTFRADLKESIGVSFEQYAYRMQGLTYVVEQGCAKNMLIV